MSNADQSRRAPVGKSSVVMLTFAELAWLLLLVIIIQTQPAPTAATPTSLEAEIQRLSLRNSSLEAELETAQSANAALQRRVNELDGQASKLKTDLAVAKTEIAKLRGQLEAAAAQLAKMREELSRGVQDLAQLRSKLAEAEAALVQREKDVEALKAKLAAAELDVTSATRTIADLNKRLESATTATAEVERLRAELKATELQKGALRARLDAATSASALERTWDFAVRKQLLGLKSERLGRVAVVFDVSESMVLSDRWEKARQNVDAWLEYLPIEHCVLLTFSSTVTAVPSDGMLTLRTPDGLNSAALTLLKDHLNNVRLRGRTNTGVALSKAYGYSPNLDTVILFTDGQPDVRGRNSADLRREILQMVEKHANVPLIVVGLGDYATNPTFIGFLRELAEKSGGTFIGR